MRCQYKDTFVKFDGIRPEHYFTSDSRPAFIPLPICGIWFRGRYAREIGIIAFVSHYITYLADEQRRRRNAVRLFGGSRMIRPKIPVTIETSKSPITPLENPAMNSSCRTSRRKTPRARLLSARFRKNWWHLYLTTIKFKISLMILKIVNIFKDKMIVKD